MPTPHEISATPGLDGSVVLEVPLRIKLSLNSSHYQSATFAPESVAGSLEALTRGDSAEAAHTARQLAAPQITYDEFLEMVDDPEVESRDLAPYFVRDESLDEGLSPGFSINLAKVEMDPATAGLEGAGLLNSANWIEKKKRQQRYLKQIRKDSSRIRIVAEGDSWFQYPFMLYDIIDHLMDRPEMGIFCCSEAGDVISSMLPKGEFYVPLQRENAAFFLFSGGGNDLVDGPGLRRFLRNLPVGSAPRDHFIPPYRRFMANIAVQYETLFKRVLRHQPGVHIVCHGYSDAIPLPREGKWLGKPMSSIGITDPITQAGIVKIIIKDLNETLAKTVARFGSNASYVDLRGIVPSNGWHDEFHPTSDWYGKVAEPIYQEILKHA